MVGLETCKNFTIFPCNALGSAKYKLAPNLSVITKSQSWEATWLKGNRDNNLPFPIF